MSFKIRISTKANLDIENIIDWYENEKKGLGKKFYLHLSRKVDEMRKHPFFCPEVYNNVRQLFLDKYPYLVHYKVNEIEKEITLYAITHTSRDPEQWKKMFK